MVPAAAVQFYYFSLPLRTWTTLFLKLDENLAGIKELLLETVI